MKIKNLFAAFLFVSLLAVSCGDDSCDVLSEAVVGTWTIDELSDETITMNSDGSLVDSDNVIFDSTFDSNTKTWDLSGNTLTVNADDGATTTFSEFDVTSFTCDQLITTDGTNTFTFNKN